MKISNCNFKNVNFQFSSFENLVWEENILENTDMSSVFGKLPKIKK
jgi:hypothetical protein